jgi:hypothetical protein
MEIEWRTVQFFINEEMGTSEVMVDALNSKKVRCTCPKFNKRAGCKHTKWVKEKMERTGGIFNLVIPPEVPDEEAMDALDDMLLFRELVIKYGKPEVL